MPCIGIIPRKTDIQLFLSDLLQCVHNLKVCVGQPDRYYAEMGSSKKGVFKSKDELYNFSNFGFVCSSDFKW